MGSAWEEAISGFDIAISSDGAWLTLASVFGWLALGWRPAVIHGAAVLTVANLAYYAVGGSAPGAGAWFALGVAGGASFGAVGQLFRVGSPSARLLAVLLLSSVLIAEGSEVFTSEGEVDDAIELAIGCSLPLPAAGTRALRAAAVAATAAILAIAAAGGLERFVP